METKILKVELNKRGFETTGLIVEKATLREMMGV